MRTVRDERPRRRDNPAIYGATQSPYGLTTVPIARNEGSTIVNSVEAVGVERPNVSEPVVHVQPQAPRGANPLPLGLASFSICVILLAVSQAGVLNSAVLPVSVFAVALTAGGICHTIVGIVHFTRGETFPGTVFLTYGGFWVSYVLISQFYVPSVVKAGADPTPAIGWFLVAYTIVSVYFMLASLATTRLISLIFIILVAALCVSIVATFSGSASLTQVSGWLLIADAFVAFYVSAALLVNDTWGRELLPTS
jgi:uncharacterized protein